MSFTLHHSAEFDQFDEQQLTDMLDEYIAIRLSAAKRVLLLPPDLTRLHSKAGFITQYLYQKLKGRCEVVIMPALGTHDPMTDDELNLMFGSDIPKSCFRPHYWRKDVKKVGQISSERMLELSEGKLDYTMDVGVNTLLLDTQWDAIVSIGQIVPHEVIGMANYTKNILIGVGGEDTIHKSHFLGAAYGMERIMGRISTPVRQALNEGYDQYLAHLPIDFILTVLGKHENKLALKGVFMGDGYDTYKQACLLSQKLNLNLLDKPIRKAVVYLDPTEFKTTWLGNKAIYRTRMAIADGGELIVLAPGLKRFGEDLSIDALIREFGYRTTAETLQAIEANPSLKSNLSAAAHLIHGTSENRFKVTYCPGDGVSRAEIEQVNYQYCHHDEMIKKYPVTKLENGWNTMPDGEEIFYVSNPALGLWATKDKFESQ